MLHAKKLPYYFCAEAMNTACYIHNRVTIRIGTCSTLYEIWKGRKPTVKYFHVFGSKCYILTDREQRRKMDPKSEEGIFLGYSANNKAYRVYNCRTKVMMESVNVVVDDCSVKKERILEDDDDQPIIGSEDVENSTQRPDVTTNVPTSGHNINVDAEGTKNSTPSKGPSIRIQKIHSQDNIIGSPTKGVMTRSRKLIANACFISKLEPKNVKEALEDEYWINDMQVELRQCKRNEVWNLVPRPEGINVIGTKWIFKNKSDESGHVTRNKARLVAQGNTQVEGVDFEETFALVSRLESIRLLLGVACLLKFRLYQMDVKSVKV